MDLLKYCYFVIWMLLCLKQVSGQHPPGLVLKDSSVGCHGISSVETQMNAACNTGHVIAINEITMGAKPVETDCPINWNSSFSTECCTNNATDCTFPFNSNKQYHEFCNGDEQCTIGTQFQDIFTGCDNLNGNYGADGRFSNYMFMDFYCVPDDHIVDMCTSASTTAESDTVYVWNKAFATSSIATTDLSCECSIEVDNCDSDIEIYKLYRQLVGNSADTCDQNITVYDADSGSLLAWNCGDNDLNFNMNTVANTYITVDLNNQVNESAGKFWFGFRASMNSNITIDCPAKPQENCIISTTTSTVPTTTTTDPPTTTTTDPPTTTTTDPPTTTTTDPPSTTSTDPPSTTTTDLTSTTTEQTTTTTAITTTTTDSPSTTTAETSTSSTTAGVSSTSPVPTPGPESDDKDNVLMIVAIVLGVICLILIIVIIIMCIRWHKKRNDADTKDVERAPTIEPKQEVARTDYKNSKLEFSPHLTPLMTRHSAASSVPNGVIKIKNIDAGCQTQTPLQKLMDATCQTAPTPKTQVKSASCQTDPVNPQNTVKSKDATCQTKLEAFKVQTEDKGTLIRINTGDVAVQTDIKKSKHKRMANKVYPDDDMATAAEHLSQAANENIIDDLIELDVPVLPMTEDHSPAEPPKKRKKKKKKHERRHDEDNDQDHTVLEVAPTPEREEDLTEHHDYNQLVPTADERYVVPDRNKPTTRDVSEVSDRDIAPCRTLNETEKRLLKHRKTIEHAFYSPEIAEDMMIKSLLRSERKKHKKKRHHTKSESKLE